MKALSQCDEERTCDNGRCGCAEPQMNEHRHGLSDQRRVPHWVRHALRPCTGRLSNAQRSSDLARDVTRDARCAKQA